MKKILLLFALFNLCVIAQDYDDPVAVGNGIAVYDSLYYGTPGDSVHIITLGLKENWGAIGLIGNSNSPVDSIKVTIGARRYSASNVPTTTIDWFDEITIRNNDWELVTRLVNTTTNSYYLLMSPLNWYLKIELVNYRATLTSRKIKYHLWAN